MEEKEKKVKSERAQRRKETAVIFSKSGGVLFAFVFLFGILRDSVLFPLGGKIWGLVLKTTPQSFLSDGNIAVLFKSPLVLITGFILILCYSFIILWETSAIIVGAEYTFQGKPIKFFDLFPASFKSIEHSLLPKNWLVFLMSVVILPFVDLVKTNNIIGNLVIPEYISDYIDDRWYLTVLMVIVVAFLFFFVVRTIFSFYYFILYKENYPSSIRKSFRLTKKKNISNLFQLLLYKIKIRIFYSIIPVILVYLGIVLLVVAMNEFDGVMAALDIGSLLFISPVLQEVSSAIITICTLMFLLVLFHNYQEKINEEVPDLVEKYEKTGKIHSFRPVIAVTYLITGIVGIGVIAILAFGFSNYPETIDMFTRDTEIAAHKGYSSVAPENTLPAFEKAIECGCADYIELDIRLSKDKVPICTHDANFEKLTGCKKEVYDMTLDEIKELSVGTNYPDYPDCKIATFEEALQMCQGKIDLIVEIKASPKSPELEQIAVELLEKYDYIGHCVVHSGNYESLKKIKAANPNIPCGLIMALSTGDYQNLEGIDFYSVEHNFVNSAMINRVHMAGKKVYAWTVNETDDMESMLELQADCIICDYPEDSYRVINDKHADVLDFVRRRAADMVQIKPGDTGVDYTFDMGEGD